MTEGTLSTSQIIISRANSLIFYSSISLSSWIVDTSYSKSLKSFLKNFGSLSAMLFKEAKASMAWLGYFFTINSVSWSIIGINT